MNPTIILASTSPFRRMLLEKYQVSFTCERPEVDESPLADESAQALVERLAREKAQAVARSHPQAYVIGSDQVAVIDGNILGKPGDYQTAFAQLRAASGKTVTFYTGVALYAGPQQTVQSLVEPFEVTFKALSDSEIENYLLLEEPYQCAGSFKSEGLGICLFERLDGRDPNTLIGLPLIALTRLFAQAGVDLLAAARAQM